LQGHGNTSSRVIGHSFANRVPPGQPQNTK
jgi:hypothetical protein